MESAVLAAALSLHGAAVDHARGCCSLKFLASVSALGGSAASVLASSPWLLFQLEACLAEGNEADKTDAEASSPAGIFATASGIYTASVPPRTPDDEDTDGQKSAGLQKGAAAQLPVVASLDAEGLLCGRVYWVRVRAWHHTQQSQGQDEQAQADDEAAAPTLLVAAPPLDDAAVLVSVPLRFNTPPAMPPAPPPLQLARAPAATADAAAVACCSAQADALAALAAGVELPADARTLALRWPSVSLLQLLKLKMAGVDLPGVAGGGASGSAGGRAGGKKRKTRRMVKGFRVQVVDLGPVMSVAQTAEEEEQQQQQDCCGTTADKVAMASVSGGRTPDESSGNPTGSSSPSRRSSGSPRPAGTPRGSRGSSMPMPLARQLPPPTAPASAITQACCERLVFLPWRPRGQSGEGGAAQPAAGDAAALGAAEEACDWVGLPEHLFPEGLDGRHGIDEDNMVLGTAAAKLSGSGAGAVSLAAAVSTPRASRGSSAGAGAEEVSSSAAATEAEDAEDALSFGLTVVGLRPGRRYAFRASAVGELGSGSWSVLSREAVTAEAVPSAPMPPTLCAMALWRGARGSAEGIVGCSGAAALLDNEDDYVGTLSPTDAKSPLVGLGDADGTAEYHRRMRCRLHLGWPCVSARPALLRGGTLYGYVLAFSCIRGREDGEGEGREEAAAASVSSTTAPAPALAQGGQNRPRLGSFDEAVEEGQTPAGYRIILRTPPSAAMTALDSGGSSGGSGLGSRLAQLARIDGLAPDSSYAFRLAVASSAGLSPFSWPAMVIRTPPAAPKALPAPRPALSMSLTSRLGLRRSAGLLSSHSAEASHAGAAGMERQCFDMEWSPAEAAAAGAGGAASSSSSGGGGGGGSGSGSDVISYRLQVTKLPSAGEILRQTAVARFRTVYEGCATRFALGPDDYDAQEHRVAIRPGGRYGARLAARNESGWSRYSPMLTLRMPPAPPAPPPAPVLVARLPVSTGSSSHRALLLAWAPATDNGAPLIDFGLDIRCLRAGKMGGVAGTGSQLELKQGTGVGGEARAVVDAAGRTLAPGAPCDAMFSAALGWRDDKHGTAAAGQATTLEPLLPVPMSLGSGTGWRALWRSATFLGAASGGRGSRQCGDVLVELGGRVLRLPLEWVRARLDGGAMQPVVARCPLDGVYHPAQVLAGGAGGEYRVSFSDFELEIDVAPCEVVDVTGGGAMVLLSTGEALAAWTAAQPADKAPTTRSLLKACRQYREAYGFTAMNDEGCPNSDYDDDDENTDSESEGAQDGSAGGDTAASVRPARGWGAVAPDTASMLNWRRLRHLMHEGAEGDTWLRFATVLPAQHGPFVLPAAAAGAAVHEAVTAASGGDADTGSGVLLSAILKKRPLCAAASRGGGDGGMGAPPPRAPGMSRSSSVDKDLGSRGGSATMAELEHTGAAAAVNWLEVDRLLPNSEYEVRVSASNSLGRGPSSATLRFSSGAPPPPPPPPPAFDAGKVIIGAGASTAAASEVQRWALHAWPLRTAAGAPLPAAGAASTAVLPAVFVPDGCVEGAALECSTAGTAVAAVTGTAGTKKGKGKGKGQAQKHAQTEELQPQQVLRAHPAPLGTTIARLTVYSGTEPGAAPQQVLEWLDATAGTGCGCIVRAAAMNAEGEWSRAGPPTVLLPRAAPPPPPPFCAATILEAETASGGGSEDAPVLRAARVSWLAPTVGAMRGAPMRGFVLERAMLGMGSLRLSDDFAEADFKAIALLPAPPPPLLTPPPQWLVDAAPAVAEPSADASEDAGTTQWPPLQEFTVPDMHPGSRCHFRIRTLSWSRKGGTAVADAAGGDAAAAAAALKGSRVSALVAECVMTVPLAPPSGMAPPSSQTHEPEGGAAAAAGGGGLPSTPMRGGRHKPLRPRHDALMLQWEPPPFTGGLAERLLSYVLQYQQLEPGDEDGSSSSGNSVQEQEAPATEELSMRLLRLNALTRYRLRIRACNEAGRGAWSGWVVMQTSAPPAPPPPPHGLATLDSAAAKQKEKAAPGASLQFEWQPVSAAQLSAATEAAAKAVDEALASLSYELEISDDGGSSWRMGYRGTKAQCMIAIGLEHDKS